MSSLKCYTDLVETKVDRPVVSIRRLELQDAVPCAVLGKLMHEDSKYAHIPFDPLSVLHLIDAAMLSKLQAWVAVDGDKLVGFLCIEKQQYFFNNAMFIANDLAFYILPAYRNIRLVRQFITTAEQWCRENNIHALTLGVTAPQDCVDTIRLYKRFGYTDWGMVVRKEFV